MTRYPRVTCRFYNWAGNSDTRTDGMPLTSYFIDGASVLRAERADETRVAEPPLVRVSGSLVTSRQVQNHPRRWRLRAHSACCSASPL